MSGSPRRGCWHGVAHLDLLRTHGKLGAIHTALNWCLHWRELQRILADVIPVVLLYDDTFRENVAPLAKAETSVRHWIHLDGAGIFGSRNFNAPLADSSPDACFRDDPRVPRREPRP
ncbi:MAG: hypothetical protein KDJ54_05555 [Candidatus Competibacteraceae bacterium]|nr:hypothetical protein [Candidatus Competibacteraceae bacterium]